MKILRDNFPYVTNKRSIYLIPGVPIVKGGQELFSQANLCQVG